MIEGKRRRRVGTAAVVGALVQTVNTLITELAPR